MLQNAASDGHASAKFNVPLVWITRHWENGHVTLPEPVGSTSAYVRLMPPPVAGPGFASCNPWFGTMCPGDPIAPIFLKLALMLNAIRYAARKWFFSSVGGWSREEGSAARLVAVASNNGTPAVKVCLIRKLLERRDLFLLVLVSRELLFLTRASLFDVAVPVPAIPVQPAMRDLDDRTDELIQKFPIVRDHQDRAGIIR